MTCAARTKKVILVSFCVNTAMENDLEVDLIKSELTGQDQRGLFWSADNSVMLYNLLKNISYWRRAVYNVVCQRAAIQLLSSRH